MQQDLNAALSQLHELQDSLTELQKANQDTQTQLREKEMINTLIMSGSDGCCPSRKSELLTDSAIILQHSVKYKSCRLSIVANNLLINLF